MSGLCHKSTFRSRPTDVRFTPESGHGSAMIRMTATGKWRARSQSEIKEMTGTVLYGVSNGVARITLKRPPVNALNPEMIKGIVTALENAAKDESAAYHAARCPR